MIYKIFSKLFIVLLIGLSYTNSYSQTDKIKIYGKIINSETDKNIPYVHILINGKRRGCIADSSGFFKIYTDITDSLKLSAIGFKSLYYSIDSSIIHKSTFCIIKMKQSSYQLKQVDIHGLGTYENFRYNFNKLKISDKLAINRIVSKYEIKKATAEGVRIANNRSILSGTGVPIAPMLIFAYDKTRKLLNFKTKIKQKRYNTDVYVRETLKDISKYKGEMFRDLLAYVLSKKSDKYPAGSYELIAEIKTLYMQYLENNKHINNKDSV